MDDGELLRAGDDGPEAEGEAEVEEGSGEPVGVVQVVPREDSDGRGGGDGALKGGGWFSE